MLWGGQAHGTKASSIPGNKALLAPRVHKEKGPGWGLSRPALGFLRVETACHPPPRPGSERSGRHVRGGVRAPLGPLHPRAALL